MLYNLILGHLLVCQGEHRFRETHTQMALFETLWWLNQEQNLLVMHFHAHFKYTQQSQSTDCIPSKNLRRMVRLKKWTVVKSHQVVGHAERKMKYISGCGFWVTITVEHWLLCFNIFLEPNYMNIFSTRSLKVDSLTSEE